MLDRKFTTKAAKILWGIVLVLAIGLFALGVFVTAPLANEVTGDPGLKLNIEEAGVAVVALAATFIVAGISVLSNIWDRELIERKLDSITKTLAEIREATVKPDADLLKIMEEFSRFLETNRKEIVDFIEGNQRPIQMGENAFAKTLEQVIKLIPLGDGKNWDKAHYELTIAVIEAFWCGWLSGAKASDGRYSKDYPQRFAKAIESAFAMGQTYAKERK